MGFKHEQLGAFVPKSLNPIPVSRIHHLDKTGSGSPSYPAPGASHGSRSYLCDVIVGSFTRKTDPSI
jgi:hypothetical protein